MSWQAIIPIAVTAVLIPLIVAEFRWRTRLVERLQKGEAFHDFLKTYLLKNAVLEFHSPDPRHREADKAIERLVEGQELTVEEIHTMVERIKAEATSAGEKKRRLQAATTLVLMDEFMESVTGQKYTAFIDYQ